ncbi:MAG: stage II sporulation protein E [Sporolactobacillus sp.]
MMHQSVHFAEGQTSTIDSGNRLTRGSIRWGNAIHAFLVKMILRTDLFYLAAGFLLGRAVILSSLTPFTVPFLAMIFWLNRQKRWLAAFCTVAGAATVSPGQAFFSLLALLLFASLRQIMLKVTHVREEKWLPALVFFVNAAIRLLCQAAFALNLVWTDVLTAAAEASLAFLITLIFMQSVPLLSAKVSRKIFKNEEIICFVILLSSILAGTIGWHAFGFSLDHVLARYVLLIFACAGGAAIGSTVGVVLGLILGLASISSLYQMSLLAFSGVLGGLLKESGKLGTSVGLMIATLLIGLYGDGYMGLTGQVIDSLGAVLLLMVTPKSWIRHLASFIPGTGEYHREQQQYIRKLRDVTVNRVEQFSSLFQTLAKSFNPPAAEEGLQEDLFLSRVTARTCQKCFKKEYCWVKHFSETQEMMLQLKKEMSDDGKLSDPKLRIAWRAHCAKPDRTLEAIEKERGLAALHEKMNLKVMESRRLVADQLHGVSQVMGDFAQEMKRERGLHEWQEEMILAKLNQVGLQVESVEIYNLEAGAIDIEVILPTDSYGASEKVVAPLLSDILGETIIVKKKEATEQPGEPSRVTFASARAFEIETGVATAARGGDFVSGDNYSLFDVGTGKYALALSDGMGNGERADAESKDTLQLLSKVLKSGIPETLAIKSINSILSLRSTEEIFATLDLALIDLQNAESKFLKIGSNPSFIKRGSQVFMQDGGNLPIGMIENFDVDVQSEQLKSGDLLIMMSDGLFDAPKAVENKEAWVKRKINELQTNDPQEIADLLLEEVIRVAGGYIEDDMTVIVARIRHHLPKWSSISSGIKERKIKRAE